MERLRIWWSRTIDVLRRGRRDRDLDEEMQAHLDLLADDFEQRGLSPAEARMEARRAFGGVDQVKAVYRDRRGWPLVDTLLVDARHGVRVFARDPWFTASAVLALALGIGAGTTMFAILYGMNWRPLPLPEPERIVAVGTTDAQGRRQDVSYADWLDYRRAPLRSIHLAAYVGAAVNVAGGDRPADRVTASFVDAATFAVLGERPELGRDFRPDDDRPGAAPVVLLSHSLWTERYGGSPSIVGRSIRVDGGPVTVIGVMPRGFRFPLAGDLWRPLAQLGGVEAQPRNQRQLGVVGRLAEGATIRQALAELDGVARGLAEAHPDTNTGIAVIIVPFTERYLGSVTDEVPLILIAAVVLLMVVACANVANLLLARAAGRGREIAMRAALGASRARIVRQLLVESLLLAATGSLIGLGLAFVGVRAFRRSVVDLGLPYWIHFGVDPPVVGFLVVACVTMAVLFGLAPALHLSRAAGLHVLGSGGRVTGAPRTGRWTSGLLVGVLALTIVLLSGAGLIVRSGRSLYEADRLVQPGAVFTARLSLSFERYDTPESRRSFYRQLDDALEAMPGLSVGALASALPFGGGEGRPFSLDPGSADVQAWRRVQTVSIGPRYLDTLGLALLRGHALGGWGAASTGAEVVVNQRFVEVYLAGEDPIGRRIRIELGEPPGGLPAWRTIAGVSPSVRQRPMNAPEPVVYLPLADDPTRNAVILARTTADPTALAGPLRDILRGLDPDQALYGLMTLGQYSQLTRWTHRTLGIVLGGFAAIALLLAVVGLYAVTSYGVSRRTQEIGVRVAMGAESRQIAWLVLRRAAIQGAAGLLIGCTGAVAVSTIARSVLAGVGRGTSLGIVLGASVLAALVVTAAALVPARRASRLDPVEALRQE